MNRTEADSSAPPGRRATKKRWKRPALFEPYWFDLDGKRLGRCYKNELREAYRLWAAHADVRTGRVKLH